MSELPSAVCSKCARPVPPDVHYCPNCQAPLTAHSVIDPFDTIRTTGYMYREASQRPKKPIVVAGIVMLLGPMFGISVFALIAGLVDLLIHPHQFSPLALLAIAIFGGGAYISGTILFRSIGNYQSHAAATSTVDTDDEDNDEDEEWRDEAEGAKPMPYDGGDDGPAATDEKA